MIIPFLTDYNPQHTNTSVLLQEKRNFTPSTKIEFYDPEIDWNNNNFLLDNIIFLETHHFSKLKIENKTINTKTTEEQNSNFDSFDINAKFPRNRVKLKVRISKVKKFTPRPFL
ncbi:MAG: hypothetical protein M3512_12090 [Bacteroidota bacterium]|nr:hypothetical protein [Bacteroidota bacterium]